VHFCYFSNSPFTFAFRLYFLFNRTKLGLLPYPSFFPHSSHNLTFTMPSRSRLLCTASLTPFLNDVWIAPFSPLTAQKLLHRRTCRLTSNHLHILRVVTEFFTANSPRLRVAVLQTLGARACFHFKVASHSYLVGLTEILFILCRSAPVSFSTSLRLPRAYSRASARPDVR